VPFLRSDADMSTAEIRLSMTSTFMKWIPCNGTNMLAPFGLDLAATKYLSRVSFLPINAYGAAWTRNATFNFDTLRTVLDEWRRISKYYYDDFYALTPYHNHTDNTGWTVWMYFDADDDSGVLQVFRQSGSAENSYKICLKGVRDDTLYNLKDIDGLNSFTAIKGSQLKNGITITLDNPSSASVIFIEKP